MAAGKFAALVNRSASRDAFDAASLLDLVPDLLQRPPFRVAFICFVASSRTDARELQPSQRLLSEVCFERDLEPFLRRGSRGEGPGWGEISTWIERKVSPAIEPLLSWSADERRFLDSLLDDGEIDAAALHDDPDVQLRIRMQPMLEWKAKHVREYRRDT